MIRSASSENKKYQQKFWKVVKCTVCVILHATHENHLFSRKLKAQGHHSIHGDFYFKDRLSPNLIQLPSIQMLFVFLQLLDWCCSCKRLEISIYFLCEPCQGATNYLSFMLHGEKINAVDQLMQKEIFYILDNYVDILYNALWTE